MRFADPQACPDCRGAIAGQSTCPHCGLDLTSAEVRQLWQTLLQADELLARATLTRDRAVLTPPPAATADPNAAPPAQPQPYVPPAGPAQTPSGPLPTYPRMRTAAAAQGTPLVGRHDPADAGRVRPHRRRVHLRHPLLGGPRPGRPHPRADGRHRRVRSPRRMGDTATAARIRRSRLDDRSWRLLTLDFFAARHEGLLGLDGVSTRLGLGRLGSRRARAECRHRPVGSQARQGRPHRSGASPAGSASRSPASARARWRRTGTSRGGRSSRSSSRGSWPWPPGRPVSTHDDHGTHRVRRVLRRRVRRGVRRARRPSRA